MKASISIVVALAIVLAVIGVLTGVSDAEPDEMSVGANLPGETLLPDCQPEQPASAPTALSQSKIGWGLGSARNQLGQPADAEAAQKKYGPLGGQFLYGSEKQIVLTFDLGYENGYTESILDVLKAHSVRGVFFITADYLSDAPGIVQRIIEEKEQPQELETVDCGSLSVSSILSYIRNNPSEPLSLQSLSAHFDLTPNYISYLIKKHTGRNYLEWVVDARITLAKKLLRDPTYRLEEIATVVGYKNYISFYNVFVKHEGVSPSDYRHGRREPV